MIEDRKDAALNELIEAAGGLADLLADRCNDRSGNRRGLA
jgi:hypothetical protein